MASAKPQQDREFFETGREPEYFCTFTKIEPAGHGNTRIFCYAEKHPGEFHLVYTVVIPAESLAGMGRRAMEASADIHNLSQWTEDMTEQ